MERKYLSKSIFCFILVLCMLCAGSLSCLAVSQYDINQLEQRRATLQEQAVEQAAHLQKLAEDSALYAVRKLALDQCIATNTEEIELLNEQIELYNQMLEEKKSELDAAAAAAEKQGKQLRTRMRAMEETTDLGYLSVLLESANLFELLGRIADINDITRYDKELEESYLLSMDAQRSITREYQELLEKQESIQQELTEKQEYLDEQTQAAAELLESLTKESADAEAEYAAIEEALTAADVEIQQMIVALQKQRAAEAAAAAAASTAAQGGTTAYASSGTGAVSSGDLIWPVPSSSLVTSQYGNRAQPTAGASTNHQGLDINASEGTTIVSAAGGTVISAGYQGGYGNCIIVDHGNGLQTVYAHLSEIDVNVGQSVAQGEAIGGAGSTGVATGPHLHYEVRNNGATTDPSQYYDGYSVWGG